MPAPTESPPKSTRIEQVLGWLAANPGWHRPVTVADALGFRPSHPIAMDLNYLAGTGRVLRKRTQRNASLYAHPHTIPEG